MLRSLKSFDNTVILLNSSIFNVLGKRGIHQLTYYSLTITNFVPPAAAAAFYYAAMDVIALFTSHAAILLLALMRMLSRSPGTAKSVKRNLVPPRDHLVVFFLEC